MMPSIWLAWSVIGNRKVDFCSKCVVNALMSIFLAFQDASAFFVASGMAGNTTPTSPTMFWHSGEPVNSTHFAATGMFLEPTQIESARPLYMLARLPLGPIGVGANPVSTSSCPNIVLIIHEPLVTIAYRP